MLNTLKNYIPDPCWRVCEYQTPTRHIRATCLSTCLSVYLIPSLSPAILRKQERFFWYQFIHISTC